VAAPIDEALTSLRVLRLEETARVRRLVQLGSYYDQSQNDDYDIDWEGYRRQPGCNYLENRLDRARYQPAGAEVAPYGYRTPTCPTMIVGHVVDTYTAVLLGDGRIPALRVLGDDTSTELLHALFVATGTWSALASARRIMGSIGAAAVVPEVIDGVPSLRVLRPEHLYVEWLNNADWVPSLVIEQRLVEVEQLDPDSGRVTEIKVWRTRAWTQTHVYVYNDVPERAPVDDDEEPIELAGDPQEHGAGRCPVVWIPNTDAPESPYGEPDCKPVLQQVDQLDRLQSMIARGAKANVDPTLVVKDKPQMLARWPSRKKGYGQMIEVSDHGDVKLLEIAGKSVETSWMTYEKIRKQIDMRVGVITIDPEVAGKVLSGLAIRLIYWTQDTRAAARRTALGKGIEQVATVWLSMISVIGIKLRGVEGKGIVLPPREVKAAKKADGQTRPEGEQVKLEKHVVGPGRTVVLNWPLMHSATPLDIKTIVDALTNAAGGRPILSQESAVAVAINFLELGVEPGTEIERIHAEEERKIQGLDKIMQPDVDEDDDKDETGGASQALTGTQTTGAIKVFEGAGESLAAEAAQVLLEHALPDESPERIKTAIDAQARLVEEQRENEPTPPAIDPAQQAAGLAKAQAMKAGKLDGDQDAEAEEDELEEDDAE
jgi:hypothetical protein